MKVHVSWNEEIETETSLGEGKPVQHCWKIDLVSRAARGRGFG